MNNMNTTASSEMKVQSRKEARGGVREGEGESATQPQNTAKRLPLAFVGNGRTSACKCCWCFGKLLCVSSRPPLTRPTPHTASTSCQLPPPLGPCALASPFTIEQQFLAPRLWHVEPLELADLRVIIAFDGGNANHSVRTRVRVRVHACACACV